ncbi:tetratricopeptide repeat protein [Streptomyces collinus]|uniref:tetratricopeptide repeat protein n=1 Tax=Streptomyces collinus TaxID=42684 RepID=UPI0029438508|nr:tetratricopeptide repeat protein [Streptomyces collinus]
MSDHIDFSGAEFTGPVIGKAEYRQQAPAPTATNALPSRTAGFTGRDEELARLRDALNPAAGSATPQAVLVAAVSGLGGVGKTALAVEAAYAARAEGWFPGGVLVVDLHGYDDAPVTADQALQSLLRALGVEPQHIPVLADERAGLFRSLLAERDALLILADNASSPDQVRPLLPGGDRHRVLVTSRDRLSQLGARLLSLEQLTPEAAYALLDRALRIADPGDHRIPDEAEAAARVADLCGHLPLALQIAAALLAEDPERTVAELAGELSTSYDRLAVLDDGDRSVRATFDLSYRRLPAQQARLLRLLALAPGPEVSEEVAAVLVDAETPPLRDLAALARAHLVRRGSGRGLWRLHDLVRAFAVGVVDAEAGLRREGEAARLRVMASYVRSARSADDRLRWTPGRPEPELFAHTAQALAWLDRERPGLVAAVLWGAEKPYAESAIALASYLAEYCDWRRHFDDKITASRAAQAAAHRIGNRSGEAGLGLNLGNALQMVGRVEEAIEAYTRAREVFKSLGNRQAEAMAWNNLGVCEHKTGRVREAIEAHTRAYRLFQDVGDRKYEATAWNHLGAALAAAGRLEEAIKAHIRACVLAQAVGYRRYEGGAWHNLGTALWQQGRIGAAIEAFTEAMKVHDEYEDWYRMGQALGNLAHVHLSQGDIAEARDCLLKAADAYTRVGAPAEAAEVRASADALTAPVTSTGTPAPGGPPGRTAGSGPLGSRPPGAPGSAGR